MDAIPGPPGEANSKIAIAGLVRPRESSGCLTTQQLANFLFGQIDPSEQDRIEEHLMQCEACNVELEEQLEFEFLCDGLCRANFTQGAVPQIEIPNHRLLRILDGGAQGQVWLAENEALGQKRAVKIIARGKLTTEQLSRFRDEVRIMSALGKHRHRVLIHDQFENNEYLALVMEYVAGGSLLRHIATAGPLPWEFAVRLVADVADGLRDVHARGILHRDIKPANILYDNQTDIAVLCDFGIAAWQEAVFETVGTPGYVAPEVLSGKSTPKSDVFSLAATLFYLVCGQAPFDTSNLWASLRQAAAGLSKPVAAIQHLPVAIQELIDRGLQQESILRPDLPEFLSQLRRARLKALSDCLGNLAEVASPRMDLSVFAKPEGAGEFRAVNAQPETATFQTSPRNERQSIRVCVATGDVVLLQVAASQTGYLTAFNLGSSGSLEIVFPNAQAQENHITAGRPLSIVMRTAPPEGVDEVVVIWTRAALQLSEEEWKNWLEERAAERLVQPVRGLEFITHKHTDATQPDWTIRVLSIVHESASHELAAPDFSSPDHTNNQKPLAEGKEAPLALGGTVLRTLHVHDTVKNATNDETTLSISERKETRLAGRGLRCQLLTPPSVCRGLPGKAIIELSPLASTGPLVSPLDSRHDDENANDSLRIPFVHGDWLNFHVEHRGATSPPVQRSVVWRESFRTLEFPLPPVYISTQPILELVVIVAGGESRVPLGSLTTRIAVVESGATGVVYRAFRSVDRIRRYRRAYLAFDIACRRAAESALPLLERLGIEVFPTNLALTAKQRWEESCCREMANCDLVIVFPSSESGRSGWFAEEVRLAVDLAERHGDLAPDILAIRQPGDESPSIRIADDVGHRIMCVDFLRHAAN
jgi:serine/threonine protein kinase